MNIYISTGGYRDKKGTEVFKILKSKGIKNIEFSGGKYIKNFNHNLKSYKEISQLHNYFPPPEKSFVFNLSSNDKIISQKSINLIKKNILRSKKIGAKYYSFHAGFRVDPKPRELGKRFDKIPMMRKKIAEEIFFKRINNLIKFAKKHRIVLLIENNVVSKKNFKSFNGNPFLLSKPSEIISFFKKIKQPNNVGLLLDVAHLKVSSRTLKFNLTEAHKKLRPFIVGYHLSDNNGIEDSNHAFTDKSWFWKGIKKNPNFCTIEVYNCSINKYKKLIKLVERKLNKNIL